jgi:hypothetical protein
MSTTTGRFLIVTASHYTVGVSISSVTDTAGNTYSKAGTTQGGDANQDNECWYTASPITGNASNVVSINFSDTAQFQLGSVSEWSHPTATGLSFDAESAHAMSNGTTLASGSVSTSAADGLLIGQWVAFDDPETLSNGTGTVMWQQNAGGVDDAASAYRIVGAAGSYTIDITSANDSAGTDNYSTIAKAFTFTTGGGGGGNNTSAWITA